MCLDLKKGAELQIATEDITVYKRVIPHLDISKLKSGMTFKGVIKGIECEGKISVEDNLVYFCTDDERLNGPDCDDKQDYIYSWVFDYRVDIYKTTIDGKPIPMGYATPYLEMPIEIGETYHSELRRDGNRVNEGLHSFKSAKNAKKDGDGIVTRCISQLQHDHDGVVVVKCIIPKGSKYYIGTFLEAVCYASDCIKYIVEIN